MSEITTTISTIKGQIEDNPILLYMKGSPDAPQCGFSAQTVQCLAACGERFAYVDILSNPEIRAELLGIYDWEGESVAVFSSLHYNATDWLELTLGAQFFAGPRLSQYGDGDPLGFLLAEVFF